jgi:two-component system LytT family sensor kinase
VFVKRVLLHIAFWIVYLWQDIVLIYLVNLSKVPNVSESTRLKMAIENCTVILLPKLLLTYFILYITLEKIVKETIFYKRNILYSVLAFSGSVFLYRALVVYYIDPVIYDWTVNVPHYFDLLGFLVAVMDIGFASGIAIVIKQLRLQRATQEKEKNLLREKLETELKFLRNQTNPHFLFNTLNNIYALARKKSDGTADAIMKLSKLLRFMLYETEKPSIKIGDEIKMLDDYIDLQKMRYDGILTIKFCREIDSEAEQISPSLLLPFVENAFKHGASENCWSSYIHINLKLEKSMLTFNIENSIEDNNMSAGNENIGLSNVKRQLEMMYKDYDMQVKQTSTLFNVYLAINLKSHAKI